MTFPEIMANFVYDEIFASRGMHDQSSLALHYSSCIYPSPDDTPFDNGGANALI
jgi:hypothetical protein